MKEKLAVDGGPKAVRKLTPEPSKLGAEELWSLVDLWEMSPKTRAKVRELILADKALRGPHLFRYYGAKPGRVAAAEDALARKIGAAHCLAVNSCTSALIASLRALGVGAGDEVIIPAYTFFATASAVVVSNAIPRLAEVDDSLNLDAASVKRQITKRTKAIIAVHMRGAPAQMDAIMDVAKAKGLPVIEDVAQSAGGSFRGRRLGAIGTMGCFSFDFYKVVCSGEGGFVTTDDDRLYARAASWHDAAACWRPQRYAPERFKGELFCGENYRLNEPAGALALEQIRKLDGLLTRLRRNKARIRTAMEPRADVTFRRLTDPEGDIGNVLMFYLPGPEHKARVVAALKAEGVPAAGAYSGDVREWHVYTHWDHITQRMAVAKDGLPWSAVPARELPDYSPSACPRTLELLSRAVSVAVGPHYSAADCRAVGGAVNKVITAVLGAGL